MTATQPILIVDDDADDREMIKDAFQTCCRADYIFLENGDRLLTYLEHNTGNGMPSLILLDLNMPGKDGREILKEIKTDKQYSAIPTIVFTTSSAPRDRTNCYELGANCVITKPDTFKKLVELAGSITRLWLQ